MKKYYSSEEYRLKQLALGRESRLRQRIKAIEKLGGKCFCCGETRYEFLAMDHVNGRGMVHRRELKMTSSKIVTQVLHDTLPPGIEIRVACHNCNQALGFYGYCPHSSVRGTV